MKYDDASWHSGEKFPSDLLPEAGATHTGMFVAWALLTGFAGEDRQLDFPDDLPILRDRRSTPGALFLSSFDGKLTYDDLNEEGNAFALAYSDFESGQYLADYERTLGEGAPTMYHVADSWDNYDRIAPVLDARLAAWRKSKA